MPKIMIKNNWFVRKLLYDKSIHPRARIRKKYVKRILIKLIGEVCQEKKK